MSERKHNRLDWPTAIIAASLVMSAVGATLLPYSDEDAQSIAIRARQCDFGEEGRPPEEIFSELRVSPFRLSFHRSSGVANGIWDTWRLSPCHELVLYGGVHHPGLFFRAEVQYRPDRFLFVKLAIPALAVTIGAGVVLSLVRWLNRREREFTL